MQWLLLLWLGCSSSPSDTSGEDACTTNPEGLVTLPADDAAHDADVEWWYWTGHFQDEVGHWYGFEHVFFVSSYNDTPAMMTHHAITDVQRESFAYDIQTRLQAPTEIEDGFDFLIGPHSAAGGSGQDQLHGQADNYVLDVQLSDLKGPVFQHEDGYHTYDFGGDTFYYSRPRMELQGTLQRDGETLNVAGEGWFDHQWGALNTAAAVGWDWFALQLDDQREIMLFVMREDDVPTIVGGSLTDADCGITELAPEEVTITALGVWQSPNADCSYPSGWDITIGSETYTLTPTLADQQIVHMFKTYWEGSATISGDATGRAYIELTEYCPPG